MEITPQRVANTFLDMAQKEGIGITNLKIQKLVYIAYGVYAGVIGEPLFKDSIEAWQHGPVIRDLYFEAKVFKNNYFSDGFYFQSHEWDNSKAKLVTKNENEGVCLLYTSPSPRDS